MRIQMPEVTLQYSIRERLRASTYLIRLRCYEQTEQSWPSGGTRREGGAEHVVSTKIEQEQAKVIHFVAKVEVGMSLCEYDHIYGDGSRGAEGPGGTCTRG